MEMHTHTVEGSARPCLRSWPQLFTRYRQFNCQIENQPYIDLLSQHFRDDMCDEDDESDYASDGENEASKWFSEYSNDNQKGVEVCPQVTVGSKEENEVHRQNSVVRRFMEGMIGDEDLLPYRDQLR